MKLFELYLEDEFDDAQFEKDCAFYLKKMGHMAGQMRMWRGTESRRIKIGKKNPWSPRTSTTDTPSFIHEPLNEYFEKRFNHPFRNGLFTTGVKSVAETYGEPYVIVPIGEFEWLSNPDFGDMYQHIVDDLEGDEDDYDEDEVAEKLLAKVRASKKWKHNVDLPGCVSSRAEVVLWCPGGYYLFNPEEGLPTAIS